MQWKREVLQFSLHFTINYRVIEANRNNNENNNNILVDGKKSLPLPPPTTSAPTATTDTILLFYNVTEVGATVRFGDVLAM